MVEKCGYMEFSLEGEEGDEMLEGVAMFKYLGITLDKTDDNWTAVRRNILRARSVWGRLGTMIQREGADPRVSAMFYRTVSQVILLYGSETWVLSAATEKKVEGAHTYFPRQITRKRARRIVDGT